MAQCTAACVCGVTGVPNTPVRYSVDHWTYCMSHIANGLNHYTVMFLDDRTN